jgi:hypothetical protein
MILLVMSKFHSPDNYWGNMRIDGDVSKKPTYVSDTFCSIQRSC